MVSPSPRYQPVGIVREMRDTAVIKQPAALERAMASRGINKVILVGNLGSDPENRMSQAGAAITNLSIAAPA